MIDPMSEERPDVIGSLPSTRPHRRSERRVAPAPGAPPQPDPTARKPPAKPRTPTARKPPTNIRNRRPPPTPSPSPPLREADAPPPPTPDRPGMAQTLVQAAAEITEIGLKASARALRGAVSRLPKP
jgi:hypothetical protein